MKLHFIRSITCMLLITFAGGCSKKDIQNYQKKCDYVKAFRTDPSGQVPVFIKQFESGTNKLEKIPLLMRNIAGFNNVLRPINVTYSGHSAYFLDGNNSDTAAILNYNSMGKLTSAIASPFFSNFANEVYEFRFIYTGSNLKEISYRLIKSYAYQPGNPLYTNWAPYVQLSYDAGYKNVTKIDFYGFGNIAWSISYTYDYTRKASNQLYADEQYGGISDFWTFTKYLNLFPEIQPKNLLIKSYVGFQYPGSYTRVYHDHVLDADGKLTNYKVDVQLKDFTPLMESWQVDWQCGKNYMPKGIE